MLNKVVRRYSDRFVSKWLILSLDIIMTAFSFILAKAVRYNFKVGEVSWGYFEYQLLLVVGTYSLCYLFVRSYSGIVRHTNLTDTFRIFKASTYSLGSLIFILLSVNYYAGKILPLSPATLLIHYFITVFTLVGFRLLVKVMYHGIVDSRGPNKKNVLIYGAGQSGLITYNTLLQDVRLCYSVVGFIDDNPNKVGKTIGGVKVYSPKEALNGLVEQKKVEEVIISMQNINARRKSQIIDRCMNLELTVKTIPPVHKWINGELSSGQIKQVNIEDLLKRDPIVLDKKNIIKQLNNRVVFVTGAAGSIGSELSRLIISYNPAMLVMIDQAETALFEFEQSLRHQMKNYSFQNIKMIVGDITDPSLMKRLFREYRPDYVFHAAAYKHVPLMENNPMQAVRTNILGTRLMADLSVEYKVKKFVMVSTDKAVNPTNVMGATKRVAEIYTQSLNTLPHVNTCFITTRFGNVLGSNGSVIPMFKKQIENGGPVTVTHPDITRYFMTINEACQLVLEAGAMGKGGEIFIFDMGEAVKIIDVARKMIKLYGLKLGKDIQIEITGLRPGEKLYEELLNVKENTIPTHNPQVMIAKIAPHSYKDISLDVEELQTIVAHGTEFDAVLSLKRIVKEFKSNNSIFEKLDNSIELEYEFSKS